MGIQIADEIRSRREADREVIYRSGYLEGWYEGLKAAEDQVRRLQLKPPLPDEQGEPIDAEEPHDSLRTIA